MSLASTFCLLQLCVSSVCCGCHACLSRPSFFRTHAPSSHTLVVFCVCQFVSAALVAWWQRYSTAALTTVPLTVLPVLAMASCSCPSRPGRAVVPWCAQRCPHVLPVVPQEEVQVRLDSCQRGCRPLAVAVAVALGAGSLLCSCANSGRPEHVPGTVSPLCMPLGAATLSCPPPATVTLLRWYTRHHSCNPRKLDSQSYGWTLRLCTRAAVHQGSCALEEADNIMKGRPLLSQVPNLVAATTYACSACTSIPMTFLTPYPHAQS